ncbi:hypothetical protein RIF29_37052 [Crotalaria pallida]|uniref:Remorin C-terminal domain-containing protein n=1 Tax=Crotalaria pallida TaxID=3830 RepID=A0AAN9HUZ3_CROPI
MKKSSGSSQKLGSFLSPIAPSQREKSIGSQKGWSSERVLQPASSSHRHVSVAGLTPINSGRTMPSKVLNWDGDEAAILRFLLTLQSHIRVTFFCNCDEEGDGSKNDMAMSPFSKCDKGTQMSPDDTENDAHSSPKSSATEAADQKNCHSTKLEVRDVEIDSEATAIRWSTSNAETQASCWDIADSTMDISKFRREEAKIIAWESLQKAKAEAEIRKLEVFYFSVKHYFMKLEKKRSLSMDKIVNKLRRAQIKAEKKRSLIPVQQDQQVSKPWKVFSFTKYRNILSPTTCFSPHDS